MGVNGSALHDGGKGRRVWHAVDSTDGNLIGIVGLVSARSVARAGPSERAVIQIIGRIDRLARRGADGGNLLGVGGNVAKGKGQHIIHLAGEHGRGDVDGGTPRGIVGIVVGLLRRGEQSRRDDLANGGGRISKGQVVDGVRLNEGTVDGGLLVLGLDEVVAGSVVLGLPGLLHSDATVVLRQQTEGRHGRGPLVQKVAAVEEGGLSPSDVGLVGNIVHAAGAVRLGKVIHL